MGELFVSRLLYAKSKLVDEDSFANQHRFEDFALIMPRVADWSIGGQQIGDVVVVTISM